MGFKSDRGGIEIGGGCSSQGGGCEFKSDRGGIEIKQRWIMGSYPSPFKSDRGGIEMCQDDITHRNRRRCSNQTVAGLKLLIRHAGVVVHHVQIRPWRD